MAYNGHNWGVGRAEAMNVIAEILGVVGRRWRVFTVLGLLVFVAFSGVSALLRGNGPRLVASNLVPTSAFHGVNGLAMSNKGELLAVSASGKSVFQIDRQTGDVSATDIAVAGGVMDLAIAADGGVAWTLGDAGSVIYRAPNGDVRLIAKNMAGVHSLAFAPGGELFVSQVGAADGLWVLTPRGDGGGRRLAAGIGGLRGFVFGPDGFIYGALAGQKAIAKIDPKTGEVVKTITGYLNAVAVAFSGDGVLYAADAGEGSLDKVDFEKGLSVRAIRMPKGAYDVVFDSRGIAFASVSSDDNVVRIDLANSKVSDLTRPGLGTPSDIAVVRDQESERIGLVDGVALRLVDMHSGAIKDWFRADAGDHAPAIGIGVGRRWIMLANGGAGTVSVIDRMKDSRLTDLRGFSFPTDAAEIEENRFAILDSSVGEISLTSAPAGEERRSLVQGLQEPMAIVADGAGGLYVTEAGLGRVVRIDLETGELSVVVDDLEQPEGIDIGLDGRIVVAEVGASRVIAVDVVSGRLQILADKLDIGSGGPASRDSPKQMAGIAVGSDGSVFVSSARANTILKLMPAN